MFCKCMLVSLFVFSLVQFQLRWRADSISTTKPWLLYFRGSSTSVEVHTSVSVSLSGLSRKYGDPLVDNTDGDIHIKDRTELEMHVSCGVDGPSGSDHRVCVMLNGKCIRTMDVRINRLGTTHTESLLRVILPAGAKISLLHYYDHMGTDSKPNAPAKADCDVAVRSGIPNVYDAPWVY